MNFFKSKWFEYIYIPGNLVLVALILLPLVGATVLGFYTPKLITQLYESFTSGGDVHKAMIALFVVFILEAVNSIFYQLGINLYVKRLIGRIRETSYKNWLLSYESAGSIGSHKYPLGEVLARLINDTEAFMELISSGSFRIFIDMAFIVSCLISFFTLNVTSGIFLVVAEIMACLILVIGGKKMGKVFMEVRKSTGDLSRTMANLVGGLRSMYYTPNGNYGSKKALISFDDFLSKQLRANIWDAGYFSLAESLFPLLLALLVIIFPYTRITEMAILAAIIDMIQRSISPIKDIAGKIAGIQRARTGLVRLVEFNDDLTSRPQSELTNQHQEMNLDELHFKLNKFSYPGKREDKAFVMRDIDFRAKAGQLVGIVGLSGSGKSTLLKMLSADILTEAMTVELREKDRGAILSFNGSNEEKIGEYKRQVSLVTQDSHVFSESLKFNITLGLDVDEGFEKFWTNMYQQLPYMQKWGVGPEDMLESKVLSLGQKQLISALRACYLRKPIVLFDEISSALDSELEFALRQLVLLVQRHSLTFIVAHRVETIIKANKILVMHEGFLVDEGNHEELIKTQQIYQEFIRQMNSLQ